MNLLLVNPKGQVIACSQPEKFRSVIGANVASNRWFGQAMATRSGDEYYADEIYNDALHGGLPVSVYATAVRRGGEVAGEVLGVIGVFFDWPEQCRGIVQDEPNLSKDEWKRSRVLLLDANFRIIASSDGKDMLTPYPLHTEGKTKGYNVTEDGTIIAYAKTLGYQEYDGLGWWSVIIQQPA
jgi:hypothetical protein